MSIAINNEDSDNDTLYDDNDDDNSLDYFDNSKDNTNINNYNTNESFEDCLKKINTYLPLLPKETVLSTITLTCMLNRIFLVNNIIEHFDDYDDLLIHKVYGGICYSANGVMTKIKNKKQNKKNNFSNVSFIFDTYKLMGVVKDGKQRKINIKLFYTGAIHMTGCHELTNVKKCLEIILCKLKKIKIVNDKEIYFVEDININLSNITNLVIQMMNTSCYSDYSIDLDATNEIVKKLKKNIMYNIIDYRYDNKKLLIKLLLKEEVSLFLFEAGSINISSKNFKDLIRAYEIINNLLYSHNLYKTPINTELLVKFLKNEN
jgi:TATA-box binding protein (TBP) (component of TFIID and TFIIIB)